MKIVDFYPEEFPFSQVNNAVPAELTDVIICGNSHEVLKRLPDNCIDLIVTSPPYNFNRKYDVYDDTKSWNTYLEFVYTILDECIRVLKWGGRMALNVQPSYSKLVPTHHLFSTHLLQKGLIWKAEIIWDKNNFNCGRCCWGSWKSPSSPYMMYTWEFIEIFCKGTVARAPIRDCADITASEFLSWIKAKWDIQPERNMKKYNHPAMFPQQIVTRLLKLFSFKGDFILDPFNGVGTTTTVSHEIGRNFLGIDISEEYCEKARSRIHNNPL